MLIERPKDASLVRCFGIDKKLADCDWDYLSTLETVREPKQGLPRLRDLLEWLVESDKGRECEDNEQPWVLLDIKVRHGAEYTNTPCVLVSNTI